MAGFVAIILSAGRGRRMESSVPKQYMKLKDKPVLWYSIQAFEASSVDSIIIVAAKADISYVQDEIVNKYNFNKVRAVVAGGGERYDSVYNGLKEAARLPVVADYVMIHDGARPFVNQRIISDCMENVMKHRACIAGMPVKDTIKVADESNTIIDSPRRSTLWTAQTPQCFELKLAYDSYTELMESDSPTNPTDDAEVIKLFGGVQSTIIEASYDNIKITTPEDIIIAEKILNNIAE